jgi:hypothetical protein
LTRGIFGAAWTWSSSIAGRAGARCATCGHSNRPEVADMLVPAMDGTFPQAGPLLFAWAVAVVVMAGWLWRAGRISDRYLAAIDAGLIPVIGIGTLLVARADLASLVLVFGVSMPMAVFMYRLTVPFIDGLLDRRKSERPRSSLNTLLADSPRHVRVLLFTLLVVVFAAPSVLILLLVLGVGLPR